MAIDITIPCWGCGGDGIITPSLAGDPETCPICGGSSRLTVQALDSTKVDDMDGKLDDAMDKLNDIWEKLNE